VTASPPPPQQGIHPSAWSFLVITAGLLIGSLLLTSQSPDWLGTLSLNPLQLRSLPEHLQAEDLWQDVLPPVLASAAFVIASRWFPRRRWSYSIVNSVLLLITLRYFAWRCTTLNTAHPFSLACSILQLLMEFVGLLILVLQLLPNPSFDSARRSRQADQLQACSAAEQASVAVWIPTYNEPERMVERAILTCRNLEHANLTITVLDDGHRAAIADLARRHGVAYLSRDGNAHRKAGNLNHALGLCQADFVAVFDCDFTPAPHFLRRTLGFFEDPAVAIVQTPQHYFQADFHSRNLGLELVMPGDLDYFYHYLQLRRDQDNAVVCCGTSYVARRQALQSIGGYVTSCVVEDYQTSTKLITQGWRVIYLNEVLSMGEVPQTFGDFLDQRLRWMQGNLQIYFCSQELPILQKLRPRQLRWYLLPADLLAPLWRATYLFMPLLGLMLGFSVITAPVLEFLAYGGPFLIALYTLPNWLSGNYHHQFWMEVYETLFCFPALARISQVLMHPFGVYGGLVTNKAASQDRQRFNLAVSWPLVLMLLLIGLSIAIRYLLPALDLLSLERLEFDGELVILAWNIYNAVVLCVAILACIDQPIPASAQHFPIQQVVRLDLSSQGPDPSGPPCGGPSGAPSGAPFSAPSASAASADSGEQANDHSDRHSGDQAAEQSGDQAAAPLPDQQPHRPGRHGALQHVWGITRSISEQEAWIELQSRPASPLAGPCQLDILEAGLLLPARIERQEGPLVQLKLHLETAEQRAALLRLLYSIQHWFHAPRHLTSGEAFLYWIQTLWRPQPLLKRPRQRA